MTQQEPDLIVLRDGEWWDESDPEVCGLIYAGSKIRRERITDEVLRCRFPKGHEGLHQGEVSPGRMRLGAFPAT